MQQTSLLVHVPDDEDVCKFATDAFLARVDEGSDVPSRSPTGQPGSPADKRGVDSFAEQLGVFAKSLTGIPTSSVSLGSKSHPYATIDDAVRQRSSEASSYIQELQDKVARRAVKQKDSEILNEGDEQQINDEKVQQNLFGSDSHITDVFDPTFRFCFEVPTHSIVHLPPQRLNITRLVFCRNYVPGEPGSCAMSDGCKFVHADVDFRTLEAHPIHVKYSWRTEDVCTYARLPAGEVLRVTAPNNRPPTEEFPSERVLVTRGSLRRHEHTNPLSHCAHYYFNRMCNRGERCNFIHVVHVDPNVVGDFKRAPCCKPKVSSCEGGASSADGDLTSGRCAQPNFKPNGDAKPFEPRKAASDLDATCSYSVASAMTYANPSPHPKQNVHLTNPVATPPMIPVQMPSRPSDASTAAAQYGMLVFVPCDAKVAPTPITPAVLNPPSMQTGGAASIHVLPPTALDLMNAAYPGLSDRWNATATSSPAVAAGEFMRLPASESPQAVVSYQVQTAQAGAPWAYQPTSGQDWGAPAAHAIYDGGYAAGINEYSSARRMPRPRGGPGMFQMR